MKKALPAVHMSPVPLPAVCRSLYAVPGLEVLKTFYIISHKYVCKTHSLMFKFELANKEAVASIVLSDFCYISEAHRSQLDILYLIWDAQSFYFCY